MDVEGRVAIVTGGAHRVGRAIALGLAEAGADVFIHYHRSAVAAKRTADEVIRMGRRVAVGSADLALPSAGADLIDEAAHKLGAATILVNSASSFPGDTLADVTRREWQSTMDVTLAGPVFLTQAFAAALPDDAEGAVVNVTDVKTARPYRKHFSYMIAKGGLDTFTRAAATALAPRVRVNAVALGVVLPPVTEERDYVEALAAELPLQRIGGVEPVADAVVALVANDFITGETVRIDGGAHLL